jgi:hypothetical protein
LLSKISRRRSAALRLSSIPDSLSKGRGVLGDIVVEELEPEIVEGEELEIDEDGEMEIRPRFPYVAMHPVIVSSTL